MVKAVKREEFWSWFLVALTAVYAVFPYAFKQKEFAHRDIVYVYGPIREWFSQQFREGVFPLWDPFMGLGRLADGWTSIPLDILSIIEVPFGLHYRTVYVIHIVVLLLAARWTFTRLVTGPLGASLITLFYLLAPTTGYFLRYYIKGWAFLLYAILFIFLYRFVDERRKWHLVWISAGTLLLTLGSKFEYNFTLFLTIFVAYGAYVLIEVKGRERWPVLVAGCLAMGCPLLLNEWNFSLIMDAARSTMRLVSTSVVWPDFWHSLSYSLVDPHFGAWVLVLFLLFARPLGRVWAWSFFVLALAGALSLGFNRPASGYALGICSALAFVGWRVRKFDVGAWVVLLAKAALLFFYFTRDIPGDADETRIIQWHGSGIQFILGAWCALGFFSRPVAGLYRWSLCILGVVLFYRSTGLVFLNYFAGIIWIPARDNFLIELPLALFTFNGFEYFLERLNRQAWNYRIAGVFFLVFLTNHPFLEKPIKGEWKNEQNSDRWRAEMGAWQDQLEHDPFGHVRIISYYHTFGHLVDVADANEYQSLVSGRFGLYSNSARLGLSREDVALLSATTGSITARFERLVRPLKVPEIVARGPYLSHQYYGYYILTATPALNCDHLRLMNIRYLEADAGSYGWSSSDFINALYSVSPTRQPGVLSEDVAEKIAKCGFTDVMAGSRKFWKVGGELPRAYFLPGVSAAEIAQLTPDDVKVAADSLEIKGRKISWKPVNIPAYRTNSVDLEADVAEAGVVVLSDLYHKRWSATVNGAKAEIQPGFFLFRAVDVAAGVSKIHFEIGWPNPMKSAVLFVLGLLGLGVLFFTNWLIPKVPARN